MSRAYRRLAFQYNDLVQRHNELLAFNRQFAANEQHNIGIVHRQNATIEELRNQVADPLRLALPSLHSKIIHRCGALFENGRYEDCIFAASKTIEDEIRRFIGADESILGQKLISEAFSGTSPRLVFSTIPAEQEGASALFRGVIGWIKNPRSHRYLDTDDRKAAFEILAFASYLMSMLDLVKVPTVTMP